MRHSRGRMLDDLYVVCFSGIPQCTDRDKELKKGVEDPWGCHSPHPLSNPDDDGGSPLPSAECNESVTALLLPMMQIKPYLTPWSRVLIEKLASKEVPNILWKRQVHYPVNNSWLLVPILNQTYPIYSPPSPTPSAKLMFLDSITWTTFGEQYKSSSA